MFSNNRAIEIIVMIALAIVALFTAEFVTFIMLGLILLKLHDMHKTMEKSQENPPPS
ncbi:hypothetical protein ACE1TF_14975 [Geomicrobium sp. JSM 1781026]|nr:hypothetical protein [Geomicrobium sp. JCM 19039]GAK10467.1 hypothetical protein JCM19039_81 [Geomicrobium sp. JCM 19039]